MVNIHGKNDRKLAWGFVITWYVENTQLMAKENDGEMFLNQRTVAGWCYLREKCSFRPLGSDFTTALISSL